jgi:hypothetical protein
MRTKFWLQNLKGRDRLEKLSEDEKIIEKGILSKRWKGVNWFHVAQDIGR